MTDGDTNEKDINWQNVIIGIVLFLLSSSVVSGRKLFFKIPMGPMIMSITSLASGIFATLILHNALNLDVLPF